MNFTKCPFHQNTFTVKYQTGFICKFNFRCFPCPLFVLINYNFLFFNMFISLLFLTITSYAHTACLQWGNKGSVIKILVIMSPAVQIGCHIFYAACSDLMPQCSEKSLASHTTSHNPVPVGYSFCPPVINL